MSDNDRIQGARLCFRNACSLLDDAALLLSNDRYARSVFLVATALEELCKAHLLLTFSEQLLTEANLKTSDFWKTFRDHRSKSALQAALAAYELSPQEATTLAFLSSLREKMLYVDLDEGEWIGPDGFITERAANEFLRLAIRLRNSDDERFARADADLLSPPFVVYDPEDPEHRDLMLRATKAARWANTMVRPGITWQQLADASTDRSP